MKKNENTVTVTLYPIIKTHYNKVEVLGQRCDRPHMTTADMTMTVAEIYEKFAGHMPEEIKKLVYYDGDDPNLNEEDDLLLGQKWETLDIVEKHEVLKQANRDLSKINDGIKARQKEKYLALEAQRKERQAEEAEWREYLKGKKSEPNGTD